MDQTDGIILMKSVDLALCVKMLPKSIPPPEVILLEWRRNRGGLVTGLKNIITHLFLITVNHQTPWKYSLTTLSLSHTHLQGSKDSPASSIKAKIEAPWVWQNHPTLVFQRSEPIQPAAPIKIPLWTSRPNSKPLFCNFPSHIKELQFIKTGVVTSDIHGATLTGLR